MFDSKQLDITFDVWPTIYEALDIISHDGGAGAGHHSYCVDTRWEPWLPAIEEKLLEIKGSDWSSKEDPVICPLAAFCVGADHEIQQQIGQFSAYVAWAFLCDFFEGW